MLQNDEALYYGKPHRCYVTSKSYCFFFCLLQISSGVAPLSRIALGFTLLFRLHQCSRRGRCYHHTLSLQNFTPYKPCSSSRKSQ